MFRATLLLATGAVAAAADLYGQPSPVISWSGVPSLYANDAGIVTDDVAVGDLAAYFKLSEAPKAAVVFSLEDAATRNFPHLVQEGEVSALVEAAHDAESGLVVPNTYGAGASVAEFVKALPRVCGAEDGAAKPTMFVGAEDAITAELEDAYTVQVLDQASLARVLSTDGTSFVYVALESAGDAALSSVMSVVQKATDGDFVAFAVPAAYEQATQEAAAGPRKLQATGTASAVALSQVRMTPNIMLGLLVSVFFIFVLHSGFGTMMAIRPNDKHWLSETVPLGNKVEM